MYAVNGMTQFTYDITQDPDPLELIFYSTNTLPQCTYSYQIDGDTSTVRVDTPDPDIFTYIASE